MKHGTTPSAACTGQTNPGSCNDPRARYIMIGGFLGAGKTTAVGKLAQWISGKKKRVGLITNDQGSHLVDTATLLHRGFAVEEIPGGCFCCRFNSLLDAAKRLTTATRPDVFIAEPVGSCTDLVATVTYPLRKLYGSEFTIAPLSVMVDPIRAMRILGLAPGAKFSDKVSYIYRKQLEEADVIVINKCDLLKPDELTRLQDALKQTYSKAAIFEVSARNGDGLPRWFGHIFETQQVPRAIIDVDYEIYADGEAQLGWLNCTMRLNASHALDGNELATQLAADIQSRLNAAGAQVAHLKMTLDANNALGDLAVVNLVRNDFVPELGQRLQDEFESGELTINLRAEAAPAVLSETVEAAIARSVKANPGLEARVEHIEFFKPGKPAPTHGVSRSA